jgi:hypothetical protein
VNVANIQRLIGRLRSPSVEDHFDLSTYITGRVEEPIGQAIHQCGSTACIAGHAVAIANPTLVHNFELTSANYPKGYHQQAQRWLGLTEEQADELFTPDAYEVKYDRVTPQIAANVLQQLINTGQVTWPNEVLS